MTEQTTTVRRYVAADATATLRCFERAVRGTASRNYDAGQIESWTAVDAEAWGRRRASAETRNIVELTVHSSITARPFFERHGFVVTAEQSVELRGSVLTNYSMRRGRLNSDSA